MIHFAIGNRYLSRRTDGLRVEMVQIRCEMTRVQLPKKDRHSFAYQNVNCHECLKLMIDDFVQKASTCARTIKRTCYVKTGPFQYPYRMKNKKDVVRIDPEILERIGLGI